MLKFHIIVSHRGAGAYSRDITTNMTPQCRAFSRALEAEKLNASLFPGPRGAVDTNVWCSIGTRMHYWAWSSKNRPQ